VIRILPVSLTFSSVITAFRLVASDRIFMTKRPTLFAFHFGHDVVPLSVRQMSLSSSKHHAFFNACCRNPWCTQAVSEFRQPNC